ncbi:unnamed protein product [Meganyctiphanes norvegica]|uniref:HMG box domain-containing protein n=1 Tax=Meganyctiphanes norvegica TaxID=48144 RepID=A0AAV2QK35_MEGNR
MSLQALPPDTIRLIKSTQVITSLPSMVKELIENSLDAQATIIAIKLENYGFNRLEVRDNGTGIKPEDIDVVAKPHYTSKITKFTDLESIQSYGFRGEALSSLCSIADVSITTKTGDSPVGHVYTFSHKGDVLTRKAAAANKGTTIVVTNLFKHIPVRRQYYSSNKRRKEELKNLEDLLYGLSLAAPHMHLTLHHDKSVVIQKNPGADLRGALLNLFPAIARKLVRRIQYIPEVQVELFLPEPNSSDPMAISRSLPDRLFVMVNNRNVNYKALEKLVKSYFIQSLDSCHGRYPVGTVSLTVPSDAVDINLEPNKDKVLLKDEVEILKIVETLLVDIYGPRHKEEKKKKGDVDETDITCTLACVTQKDSNNTNVKKGVPVQRNTENNIEDVNFDFDTPSKIDHAKIDESFVNYEPNKNNEDSRKCNANLKIVFEEQPTRKDHSQDIAPKIIESRSSVISPLKSSSVFTVVGKSSQMVKKIPIQENVENVNFTSFKSPQEKNTENSSKLSRTKFITSTQENEKLSTPSRHFMSSVSTIAEDDDIGSIMKNIDDDFDFDKEVMQNKEKFCNIEYENKKSDDLKNFSKISETDKNLGVEENGSKVSETDESQEVGNKDHVSLLGSDGIPVFVLKPPNEVDIENDGGLHPMNDQSNIHHSTVTNPIYNFHTNLSKNKDDKEKGKDVLLQGSIGIEQQNSVYKSCSQTMNSLNEKSLDLEISRSEKLSKIPQNEVLKSPEANTDTTELNKVYLKILDNVQSHVEGSWSRGQLAGTTGNIQTVELSRPQPENFNLKTSPTIRKDLKNDNYFTPNNKRLRAPSSDLNEPSIKRNKLKSMSPADFDYVYGKRVKRALSDFNLYCRETRSKVISELPGANFADIAKEMASRWKTLDPNTKKHYQDLASNDQIRYQEEVQNIKESRGLDTSLNTSLNKSNVSRGGLDRFLAPVTPQLVQEKGHGIRVQSIPKERPWRKKVKDVKFKLDEIKRKSNENRSINSGEFSLIGSVGGGGGWLCMRGSDITSINTSRLHELVLNHTLLSSFSLPAPSVLDPIIFNSSELGEDNWSLLLRLDRIEQPDHCVFNVTDKRIHANGFRIVLYPKNKNPSIFTHGEIIGLSNCVGFYGLSDLIEILKSISCQSDISLHNSRPIKLKQWIKGEAVRMCRNAANFRNYQEVQEKIEQWKRIFNKKPTSSATKMKEPQCIHYKPIFTTVFSLSDIPLSQSSQTYLEDQMECQA